MIDERDLLKRIIASAEVEAAEEVGPGLFDTRDACRRIISILDRALATQPEPAPALPEFVTYREVSGSWHLDLPSGLELWISDRFAPDDLDRIAETCRILAARERARRAGS